VRLLRRDRACDDRPAPGCPERRARDRGGGSWYLARQENLPGLSLGQVLVTVLAGAIALMLFQYRRLRQAAGRPASSTAGEGE